MQPPWAPQPAPPTAFREGQREWEPHDGSERWGDVAQKTFATTPAAPAGPQGTTQLVRAQSKWPLTWLVQFDAAGTLPAAEVASVNVDFRVTTGCGQAETTYTFRIVLTAANGYAVPPIVLPGTPANQIFVPASSLNITCVISYTPTVAAPTATFRVAAMAAPFTSMSAPRHPGA